MIENITGNDYAAKQRLNEIVAEYKNEFGDLSYHVFEGDDYDADSLQQAVVAVPMLASKSLVVLRGLSERKDLHDRVQEMISDVPDSTELIIFDPAMDKRTKLYKHLSNNSVHNNYEEMNENQLARWLLDIAKEHSADFSMSQAMHLIRRVGTDRWRLSGELDKLIYSGKKIDNDLIDELVEENPQNTVFELLDATMQGRVDDALNLYGRLRKQQLEPGYILSMITWQLFNITLIKYAGDRNPDQIAKEANVSPFVIKKTMPLARSIKASQLNYMNKMVVEADLLSKTASVETDLLVEQLITKLASSF